MGWQIQEQICAIYSKRCKRASCQTPVKPVGACCLMCGMITELNTFKLNYLIFLIYSWFDWIDPSPVNKFIIIINEKIKSLHKSKVGQKQIIRIWVLKTQNLCQKFHQFLCSLNKLMQIQNGSMPMKKREALLFFLDVFC